MIVKLGPPIDQMLETGDPAAAVCIDCAKVVRLENGIVMRGQSFDLLDVENRVALQERNFSLGLFAGSFVTLRPADAVGIDDKTAVCSP